MAKGMVFFISFLSFFIIDIIIKWEHYQIVPKVGDKGKDLILQTSEWDICSGKG